MDSRGIFAAVLVCAAFFLSSGVLGVKNGKFMSYTINNKLQDPMFEESMDLKIVQKKNLIYYMEQAVMTNPSKFTNFKATFTSPYGYFIDSINSVAGNWPVNQTYWQILSQDGPLQLGVSSYIPKPGDDILFNFTFGTH